MTLAELEKLFEVLSGPFDDRDSARFICDLSYSDTPGATVIKPDDSGYYVAKSKVIAALSAKP